MVAALASVSSAERHATIKAVDAGWRQGRVGDEVRVEAGRGGGGRVGDVGAGGKGSKEGDTYDMLEIMSIAGNIAAIFHLDDKSNKYLRRE